MNIFKKRVVLEIGAVAQPDSWPHISINTEIGELVGIFLNVLN